MERHLLRLRSLTARGRRGLQYVLPGSFARAGPGVVFVTCEETFTPESWIFLKTLLVSRFWTFHGLRVNNTSSVLEAGAWGRSVEGNSSKMEVSVA